MGPIHKSHFGNGSMMEKILKIIKGRLQSNHMETIVNSSESLSQVWSYYDHLLPICGHQIGKRYQIKFRMTKIFLKIYDLLLTLKQNGILATVIIHSFITFHGLNVTEIWIQNLNFNPMIINGTSWTVFSPSLKKFSTLLHDCHLWQFL